MSTHADRRRPITILDLKAFKQRGERFVMLTAYDAMMARILDDAGVPVLLVGDSLGMVVLGHDSTVPVTMDDMLHHTSAVRRGAKDALIIADMPFGSFQVDHASALRNATRLLQAGASGVKLEGAGPVTELVADLTRIGIPVMGHVGLTPQAIHQLGGFRVQGRQQEVADRIVADGLSLAEAGAFAVVLECVPTEVGRRLTESTDIPIIGIGAGPHTDAQVLVINDLIGMSGGRQPRFVKAYADLRGTVHDAAKAFQAEVSSGDYPAPEHTY